MSSVVDICNSALNQIGASNIISLTEDSKAARVCNQRYEFVRDSVFRAHPWNCLTVRRTLSPDTAAPAFEFTKQFTLPTDPYCLRVLALDEPDVLYRIEGRKLLCNESTINMIYIGRETDPAQYDMLLMETISASLAADIAYNLVGSSEDNAINTSVVSDSRTIAADTFINSRF